MTRQRLVGPLPIAYALLGCFFLAERLLRRGPEAASLEAGQTDQGTTRAIGRAFGQSIVALSAAPLLKRWRLGRLAAPSTAWSAIAAMVAELTVRVWAQLLSNFLAFSVALLSVSLWSSYHAPLCWTYTGYKHRCDARRTGPIGGLRGRAEAILALVGRSCAVLYGPVGRALDHSAHRHMDRR